MASVVRDTGEIWSRLFDHRPFLHGEIRFFVREFQDKRNDREIEQLFKILEYTTELKQNQLDRTEELGDTHLPGLKANVDVALSMCERVLQKVENANHGQQLEENRRLRKAEWEKFINHMSVECAKVDKTFLAKENEIRQYYIDVEEKLHIAP